MIKRIDYLDYAKGISIILVVLGHIYTEGIVYNWLYSFHIPLFFIVSGMLIQLRSEKISNTTLKDYFLGRSKALMIPYFSLTLLNLVFNMGWEVMAGRFSLALLLNEVWDILILCGRGAVWFLPCLFISEIVFYVTQNKIKQGWVRTLLILSLFTLGVTVPTDGKSLSLAVLRSFIAVFFLAIGHFLMGWIEKIDNYYILSVSIMTSLYVTIQNGWVDLYSLTFNDPLIYVVGAVAGTVAILIVCRRIKNRNAALMFYGRNSLIVMGTHLIPIKLLNYAFIVTVGDKMNAHLRGFIILVIVLLLEIMIVYVFNTYLYATLGRGDKKRESSVMAFKSRH